MKIVNTLAKLIELIITKCGLITPKQFEELMSKVSKEQSYVVGEYTMRNILITCFLFGGSYLYVPTLTTVYKWVRDAEIYRLYKVGNSTKDLALMSNINRRRVYQIINIVLTLKYIRKIIYNQYRESIGQIITQLCNYKGVEIIEGHLMPDHVHMLVSITPKISVSSFMGYLKGKSALMIFDRHANLKYKFGNRHFWSEVFTLVL